MCPIPLNGALPIRTLPPLHSKNNVKKYKETFVPYSLEGISLSKVRLLLKEIQEADQRDFERVNPSEKQTDQNADVYLSLKEGVSYLYEVLDFLYHITDEYLSS